jgi:uncharacterized protein (DUF302 family)
MQNAQGSKQENDPANVQRSEVQSGVTHSYGYRREVSLPFDEAVARTYEKLKDEGFGVLTEIDLKEKFREKLDVDFRKYVILGACNPSIAHQALQEEIDLGLLLPCNVIVYEKDGGSVVAAVDARSMLSVTDNKNLEEPASLVNKKLVSAINAI